MPYRTIETPPPTPIPTRTLRSTPTNVPARPHCNTPTPPPPSPLPPARNPSRRARQRRRQRRLRRPHQPRQRRSGDVGRDGFASAGADRVGGATPPPPPKTSPSIPNRDLREMNYAIIKTGGKQYRVQPGDTLDVELLPNPTDSLAIFGEVLAVSQDGQLTVGNRRIIEAQARLMGRHILGELKKIPRIHHVGKRRETNHQEPLHSGPRYKRTAESVADLQQNDNKLGPVRKAGARRPYRC